MSVRLDRVGWMTVRGPPARTHPVRGPVMDPTPAPTRLTTRMGGAGQALIIHRPVPAPAGAARPLIHDKIVITNVEERLLAMMSPIASSNNYICKMLEHFGFQS